MFIYVYILSIGPLSYKDIKNKRMSISMYYELWQRRKLDTVDENNINAEKCDKVLVLLNCQILWKHIWFFLITAGFIHNCS